MSDLNILREYVRNTLRQAKKMQRKQLYESRIEEYKLRKEIRKLIREAEDIVTHESTGINVLADLLETIVPILKSFYKKLGTDLDQRKSFRSHIIKSVQNLLAPVSVMFKAGGTAGGKKDLPPNVSDAEVVEEEEIKVKVGDSDKGATPEKDPAFIPLKADQKAEKEKQVDKDPKPEDAFVELPGEDETGRNIALQSFKRVEKQIREAYTLLANQEDRDLFYDYLITNLKLYFDKFEDELQSTVPEPTTAEYEAEKKKKEASLGIPAETPEASAAPEEQPVAPTEPEMVEP